MTKERETKEVASITCSFKLTPSDWQPYEKIIKDTGIKKGTLLRNVFISKSNNIDINKVATKSVVHKDIKRITFLINKSSNNLNQIAHNINSAYRTGIISESVFIESLNKLITIENTLLGLLDVSKNNNG